MFFGYFIPSSCVLIFTNRGSMHIASSNIDKLHPCLIPLVTLVSFVYPFGLSHMWVRGYGFESQAGPSFMSFFWVCLYKTHKQLMCDVNLISTQYPFHCHKISTLHQISLELNYSFNISQITLTFQSSDSIHFPTFSYCSNKFKKKTSYFGNN